MNCAGVTDMRLNGRAVNTSLTIAWCCTALIAAGCRTLPQAPAVFSPVAPHGAIVHVKSGFVFPLRVGDFIRERPTQYDAQGEDVSVGYNDYVTPIAATVYVYPTHGRPLADEFEARQAEVSHGHGGVQLLSTSHASLTPRAVVALAASYAYDDVFAGRSQPLRSELLVAQSGERFVEYRFSYPAAAQQVASGAVAAFQQMFSWP